MAIKLTTEQQAEMESLGLTTEEFETANTRDELPAGTYRGTIASGKVAIVGGDHVMTDSIEANFRVIPNDSNGNPVPRLSTFFKFNLPMKHGRYTPNAISLQVGMSTLRALAAAGNTTVPALVESIKTLMMPVELIGAAVVVKVAYKEGKDGSGRKFSDVRLDFSKEPKLTPFKASGSAAASSMESRNNAVADDSVPF